uniref:Uncharacterized protein n=1 Tax=Hyaloperonospora arabidopsidis (strain Emoy2) TaxID=559515 RepID=M4C525_HYAAE
MTVLNLLPCRRCHVRSSAAGVLRSRPLVVGADVLFYNVIFDTIVIDLIAAALFFVSLLLVSLLLLPLWLYTLLLLIVRGVATVCGVVGTIVPLLPLFSFTSADGDISVLLRGLVDAVYGFLNSKDNTLDVESLRGNDNTHTRHSIWSKCLRHFNIHIIRVNGIYIRLSPTSKHNVGICVPR